MKKFNNWQFNDIVQFLKQNYFKFVNAPGTSHHYYEGNVDGEQRIVQVPRHDGKSIKPKTFRYTIIPLSGIPESEWLNYSKLPPNQKKKFRYKGSKEVERKQEVE